MDLESSELPPLGSGAAEGCPRLCQTLPRAPAHPCRHRPCWQGLGLSSVPVCPSQWHRMPTTQETDGFQVKRPGDVNVKCTLLLMLDHQVRPGATKGQPGVGMDWDRALDETLGVQGLKAAWGAPGMDLQ